MIVEPFARASPLLVGDARQIKSSTTCFNDAAVKLLGDRGTTKAFNKFNGMYVVRTICSAMYACVLSLFSLIRYGLVHRLPVIPVWT